MIIVHAISTAPQPYGAEARTLSAILTPYGERRIEGGSGVRRLYNPLGGHPEQGGAVMHEEAIPILRADATVSSESTPTISQAPWRRASCNSATWPAWNRSPTMSARCPVSVKPC